MSEENIERLEGASHVSVGYAESFTRDTDPWRLTDFKGRFPARLEYVTSDNRLDSDRIFATITVGDDIGYLILKIDNEE